MPARAASDLLRDVLEAIDAIAAYTKAGKQAFERDAMMRDAVCARLMQIGQAVKDAQAEGLDLSALRPEIPWRNVTGMRDLLAHKYALLDKAIVWRVVEVELPRLKTAVEAILRRR